MRIRLALPALAVALCLTPAHSRAQPPQGRPTLAAADSGTMQRITLKDGSELLGRIVSVGETSIQFQSSFGVSTISIDAIANIREERWQVRRGQYYFANPNETRLVFAPTGRNLRKGEGYFSDYWIFFPGFAAGLSNRFTIGGGMSIFPFLGIDEQLMYLTPKLGVVQSEKFNAAVGVLYVTVPTFEDASNRASGGMLYGVGTWGRPDQSFTAGLGYGFANGELARTPALLIGGETRIAPRASLVTENYIVEGQMLLGGGVRFLGRGLSVDLALFSAAGEEHGCCFPFLGFVYAWGR